MLYIYVDVRKQLPYPLPSPPSTKKNTNSSTPHIALTFKTWKILGGGH